MTDTGYTRLIDGLQYADIESFTRDEIASITTHLVEITRRVHGMSRLYNHVDTRTTDDIAQIVARTLNHELHVYATLTHLGIADLTARNRAQCQSVLYLLQHYTSPTHNAHLSLALPYTWSASGVYSSRLTDLLTTITDTIELMDRYRTTARCTTDPTVTAILDEFRTTLADTIDDRRFLRILSEIVYIYINHDAERSRGEPFTLAMAADELGRLHPHLTHYDDYDQMIHDALQTATSFVENRTN